MYIVFSTVDYRFLIYLARFVLTNYIKGRVFPPSTKLLVGWPYFILKILRLIRTRAMGILELLYIPLDTLALIDEIFLTTSLLWVCQRPGLEPTIFPSGEAAGSLAPLNARPHLLRQEVGCLRNWNEFHLYDASIVDECMQLEVAVIDYLSELETWN